MFLVNTPLLEIVDDKWRTEKLPDDGAATRHRYRISFDSLSLV